MALLDGPASTASAVGGTYACVQSGHVAGPAAAQTQPRRVMGCRARAWQHCVMRFIGVSHIALTVRDLAASERWYREVFGLERLEEAVLAGHRLVALVHRETDIAINLHVHVGNRGDAFDERQTGLDHLSLLVEDRRSLDVWAAHLDALGVPHSPIVDEHYGSVLVFRDPDGIQLELFSNASAPRSA